MVFLLSMAATAVAGDYYKWVDENGIVHVSDSLAAVPPEYRNQIEPMRLVDPEPSPPTSTPEVVPPAAVTVAAPPAEAEFARFEAMYEPESGPYNEVIRVNARLNDRVTAPLFVDTGSSDTMISVPLARRLGLFKGDLTGLAGLVQATGSTVQGLLVVLDKVEIAGAVSRFVPAMVVASISPSVDGLLGMGFLSQFNEVHIDSARHVITFLERPATDKAPDGRDEQWWRNNFKRFSLYRKYWKEVRSDLRLGETYAGWVSKDTEENRRAFAEAQFREAEKLYAKLNRYAIQHDVPMEWRVWRETRPEPSDR
jgi:clan AA aspartic protease (TIGR02281 family)